MGFLKRWKYAIEMARGLSEIDWEETDNWFHQHNTKMLAMSFKNPSKDYALVVVIGRKSEMAGMFPT